MSESFHDFLKNKGEIGEQILAEKKNWIQNAFKSIEKKGTKGVCTGEKFGSESCPKGSKRYNMAKTLRKLNKS